MPNLKKKTPNQMNLNLFSEKVEELILEAEALKIPNAYISDIKEMRKVIRIIEHARGKQ